MKKIAIIGMGVAGISVLRAMDKYSAYKDCHIVLYDRSQTFGTGFPYQEDSESLLINQTADTMSLELDNAHDFVEWVKMAKGIPNGNKTFYPRTWYGEYLRSKLSAVVQKMNPQIIQEEVKSLRVQKEGTYLVQTDYSIESYDSVHLCIGHLPYQDPYHLKGNPRYIYQPYPVNEKIMHFPEQARIGIIGTGLTSIDLMRVLNHQHKHYQISFFSRYGQFPLYRGYEPDINLRFLTIDNVRKEQKQHNGFVPLEKMEEWFYLECQDKGIDFEQLRIRFGDGTKEQLNAQLRKETDLGMLQSIIHRMDAHLAEFLQSLTETDKKVFFTQYEPLFKHFRAPMPKTSLEELMRGWNAGEIQVWDDMYAVKVTHNGFDIQLKTKQTVRVDYLVNATGHEMNVGSAFAQTPLMKQLLDERILQPERFGGVQVVWPSAQAISQRYGLLNRLYVHGQLVQGIQYGNNAHLLMQQAEQVVAKDFRMMNDE